MDAKTKKTWLSIALAIVIICAILGVAAIGTAVYVFRQHITTQFVPVQTAQREFDRARQRFAGQDPLIELSGDREPVIHRRIGKETEIHAVRVLAYDPHAGKLVHATVPFWLLRLTPSRKFSLHSGGGFDFDSDGVQLTIDDVERAGPGLLLDARDRRDGTLVLVWTE